MPNLSPAKRIADKRVKPILKALQTLALDFTRRPGGREKLMRSAGLAKNGVNAVLYHGAGTQYTWLNVFLCVFELNPELVVNALERGMVRSGNSGDPVDERWFEITKQMSLERRNYWLSIIEYAEKIERRV